MISRMIHHTTRRAGLLIGAVVLIPFMLVVGLGIHSYLALADLHKKEQLDNAATEARLLQTLLSEQLNDLSRSHQAQVRNALQQGDFSKLNLAMNSNSSVHLITVYSDEGLLYPYPGLALPYTNATLLNEVKTDIRAAHHSLHNQLQDRPNNRISDIWLPVTTSIGSAYLYCWAQQPRTTVCTLSRADAVYDWVWNNSELSILRQRFHIDDSFNHQAAIPEHSMQVQFSYKTLGLIITPLLKPEPQNTASDRWLLLAMILPLLGLSCAIGYVIYRHYKVQVSRAETLLSCTQDIAHELRTPLGNINLYVGLMLRSGVQSDKERYQVIVDNEMQRISQIIDNATALMRGTPTDPWEYLAPASHLQSLNQQYQRLLQSSGCALVVETSDTQPHWYPKNAVDHVLLNLLDNARKYAPGDRITLGSATREDELIFWVHNQHQVKIGLPPAPSSGLGLGLQTCERLAAQFNGRLEAKITSTGREYRLCLPLLTREPPSPC